MDGSLGTESKSKKVPAAAGKSAPAYDPDKDYISTLLLELGRATAIVDLLYMVACGKTVDSPEGSMERGGPWQTRRRARDLPQSTG
jgi:hypothetical protein